MFPSFTYFILIVILLLYATKTCKPELIPPSLVLYSPGAPEYTEVVVKRVHDDLLLVCELRGETAPRGHVWNYVPGNGTLAGDVRSYSRSPRATVPTLASNLTKTDLQEGDSGHYMCSAPPFSVTKYVIVQSRVSKQCARSAFGCGARCVLADHVCDGKRDCLHGEDEADHLCPPMVCSRTDRLNCSTGRCVPEVACCRTGGALCSQPACCNEHPRYSRLEGYVDVEYPSLYEDRHAPDDYGFIQSTIYTVTACALIFMIAVVLLVSAICKMHMKRAALRSYAHAESATRHHYNMHYAQAGRPPPRYEACRLLDPEGTSPPHSPAHSPHSPHSPQQMCGAVCPDSPTVEVVDSPTCEPRNAGFGLARLSALLSSRYRQVPTQCTDVEMTTVRPSSASSSPTRHRPLDNYRSPTYCDLNAGLFLAGPEECGRDLNYMATPLEFLRRRAMRRNTLERVMDQIDTQRLTLQLGRFQLTLPSFGRRASSDRRPDTPNVAEINIDDIDFVRLNGDDTYTLNGRTIRLLGANFENYPVLSDGTRPPPYNEAMRYKLYGPPPEYLSREGLNQPREVREEEARTNVEMPPCYDELASGINVLNNNTDNGNVDNGYNEIALVSNGIGVVDNGNVNNNNDAVAVETINSVIDNLPAIDFDVNANDLVDNGVSM